MSQGRPIPPEHFAKFLELLREVPNVTRAARTTGHAPSAFRRYKALDKEFSQAWDEALDESIERMEEEVHRRAISGVDEPLTHQGQFTYQFEYGEDGRILKDEAGHPIFKLDAEGKPVVSSVKKYSDQLAMFLLKAHRPEKYRERSEVNLSNPDGSLTLTDAEKAAKIAAMIALAKSRQIDNDGSDLC
jgi:hypothetical protein